MVMMIMMMMKIMAILEKWVPHSQLLI